MSKNGRPRKEVDLALVEDLARIGCTDEDISEIARIHPSNFYRRKKKEEEFCEALKKGRANMRMSLRRAQFRVAEEGNPTLLIWLGKQFLGQTDRLDVSIVSDESIRAEILRRGVGRIVNDDILRAELAMLEAEHAAAQDTGNPSLGPGLQPRQAITTLS